MNPPSLLPTTTRTEALARLRRAFAEAGLDAPALDARLLLVEALGIDPLALTTEPGAPLGERGAARLAAVAARRLAREPVARILGLREFWGLSFALSPGTLVPRPDTETVVETALALLPDRNAPARVLDLGSGSGCLLVALLHERPAACGLGIDRSLDALGTARANAARNGVAGRALFVRSDWGEAAAPGFDLVVSNPPYIPTADLAGLAAEVRDHDPAPALDGGPDGLDAYRMILADARRLLAPGGHLVVEIGFDQEEALRALAPAHGLATMRVARDLGGHPRAVALKAT